MDARTHCGATRAAEVHQLTLEALHVGVPSCFLHSTSCLTRDDVQLCAHTGGHSSVIHHMVIDRVSCVRSKEHLLHDFNGLIFTQKVGHTGRVW